MHEIINVLFIALDVFPYNTYSDKKYVIDLVANLPEKICPAIFTISANNSEETLLKIGNRKVHYTSISSIGIFKKTNKTILKTIDSRNILFRICESNFKLVLSALTSLRNTIKNHNSQIIHFVDDIGPAIYILKKLYPDKKITCAKPSIKIQNKYYKYLYKKRIKSGLKSADIIIPYSNLCSDILLNIGLKNKYEVIPWGVVVPEAIPFEKIRNIRRELSCPDGGIMVLGSPRLVEENLAKTVKVAERVCKNGRYRFVFSVKPTMWKRHYSDLSVGGITVMRSPHNFYEILEAADILFAPQGKGDMSCLPPLLWLEAMVRGTPVITEDNPGVSEIIEHLKTGFIINDIKSAPQIFERINNSNLLDNIKEYVRKASISKYNIIKIANKYADLWASLI